MLFQCSAVKDSLERQFLRGLFRYLSFERSPQKLFRPLGVFLFDIIDGPQRVENLYCVKSTQYMKLAPNTLLFTY